MNFNDWSECGGLTTINDFHDQVRQSLTQHDHKAEPYETITKTALIGFIWAWNLVTEMTGGIFFSNNHFYYGMKYQFVF